MRSESLTYTSNDSSETKSILDFSIWLSLSPPGKNVCYRERRIHNERASQFFLLFTRYFFCSNHKLLKCVNQYRLEEKASKLNLVIR